MSYCRFGWNGSNVYVYEGSDGLVCCGCSLRGDDLADGREVWPVYPGVEGAEVQRADYAAMVAHLEKHRRAGHKVPQNALDDLSVEGKLWNRHRLTYPLRMWWWRNVKRRMCRRFGHVPVPTFPPMPDVDELLSVSLMRSCSRCGDLNPNPDGWGWWMQDELDANRAKRAKETTDGAG